MELSIIIPTYNRNRILFSCLASVLEAAEDLSAEIIVVNDNKENVIEFPQAWRSRITLVNNRGKGVAAARNTGAAMAGGNLYLFIDDDILVTRSSLLYVHEFHSQYKKAALNVNWEYPPALIEKITQNAFGRYLVHCGHTSLKGWLNNEEINNTGLIRRSMVASYFLSMTREDFDMVHGYDEKFPYAGAEDYDFPKRLSAAGITFYLNTDIFVYHNEEDKTVPAVYLKRYFYIGQTRRVAYDMGYQEMAVILPLYKRIVLRILEPFYPVLFSLINFIGKFSWAEKIYYKGIFTLVALNLHKGFRQNKKPRA